MKQKIFATLLLFTLLAAGARFFWSKGEQAGADSVAAPLNRPSATPMPEVVPTICGHFFKVACENKKIFHDPTGVVDPDLKGELEALRLYETIMHHHKDWTSKRVEAALVHKIYTTERVKQLHETFNWVKNEIQKFIERQPPGTFSEEEKAAMLKEVGRTTLELPPPASVYSDELDLLTKNDVYYEQTESGKKRMRVGGAYLLAAKSWFNRVFTFAHELAHSIDPCEMSVAGVHIRAYDRLESCMLKHKILKRPAGWVACGDRDQYAEAFADWVASSITAEALVREVDQFKTMDDREAGVINAVKDICDEGSSWVEIDTTQHPAPRVRVENIFGTNQEVRRFLDCHIPRRGAEQCTFGKE